MEDYNDLIIQQINNNEIHEPEECFICFELQKAEEIPIQLKHQTIFLKFCSCDGWIHNSCLKIWFDINEKCPICRRIMLLNTNFDLQYGFLIYYYIYIIKICINKFIHNIVRLRNFFIFCAIIANILNIISNCFKHINNNYEYTYDYNLPTDSYYIEPAENRIIPIND